MHPRVGCAVARLAMIAAKIDDKLAKIAYHDCSGCENPAAAAQCCLMNVAETVY